MVEVNLQDCKPSFSSDNHTNQYFGLQTCNWKSGLGFSSFSFQYYLKSVLPRPKISSSEIEGKGAVTKKGEITFINVHSQVCQEKGELLF